MTLTEPTRVHRSIVPPAPRSSVRATVAAGVMAHALRGLPVRVQMPDGKVLGTGDAYAPTMRVVRPDAFLSRMGADVKIGFGEAYIAGDWEAAPGTDLADLLTPFAERIRSIVPRPVQWLRRYVEPRIPVGDKNTKPGARRNIERHYDLSNDLFGEFLDPTMSYSSAWFPDHIDSPDDLDLQKAQERKIDGVLDYARVGPGTRVLEIGTGWGALAIRAAQRGAEVTTITISREQAELARQRFDEADLGDRIDLRLTDYREVVGEYDAIVSVEMIEAVGEEYWPTYFATLDRLLAPGGRVSLQAITMDHERMLATRHSYGWVHKYIFPGGLIPSLQAIDETLAAHTGLYVQERRELGLHYAETLRQWRTRFNQRWEAISDQGFDETFQRMWNFYLAYCEAGFRTEYLGVSQLAMARRPELGR